MAAKQEIGQIIDQAHEFITTPTSEKLRLRNFRWFFSLDNNVDTKAFFQIEGANDHLFCVHTENTQITAWVTKPTPESKVLDEHYGIHVLVDQDNIFEAVIGSGIGYSIKDWLEACFGGIDKDWHDFVRLKKSGPLQGTR